MKLKDILGTIGSIAPTIAKVVGGPLAGTAVSVLAKALGLGDNATEDQVAQVIATATPDQILAIKKADQDFAVRMRELDIRMDEDYIQDTANARQAHKDNAGVFWLGIAILATFAVVMTGVIGGYFAIMTGDIEVKDIALVSTASAMIGTVVGYVAANAQQVVSYFFGSSRGSNDKTQAMAQAVANIGKINKVS